MNEHQLQLRERLMCVVEETDTALGRAFELSIQVLVVISLISVSIDTRRA
jgi:hypothetical protein